MWGFVPEMSVIMDHNQCLYIDPREAGSLQEVGYMAFCFPSALFYDRPTGPWVVFLKIMFCVSVKDKSL